MPSAFTENPFSAGMVESRAHADDNMRRFLENPRNTCPADPGDICDTGALDSFLSGTPSTADLKAIAAAAQGLDMAEDVEEYKIWTPRSWSDNESLVDNNSAGMSTTDLSKILPGQTGQVPKDLLDVIERQDSVIERLVTWCKNLEEQSANHQTKLEEHEKLKADYNALRSKLRTELFTLRADARRKAKAHSAETSALYERMQAKVDARVAVWVQKHEVMKSRQKQVPKAKPVPTGAPMTPQTGGAKRPSTPQQHSNRVKTSTPFQRAATSPSMRGPAASPTARLGSSPSSKGLVGSPRGGKSNGQRSSTAFEVDRPSALKECFERSASPDASRRSKRPFASPGQRQKSPVPSSGRRSPGEFSTPTLGRANRDSHKALKERSSPGSRSGCFLGQTPQNKNPSVCSTPRSAQTPSSARKNSDSRLVSPGALLPVPLTAAALKSSRPLSPGSSTGNLGTGQSFRFTPRSVSPVGRPGPGRSPRPSSPTPALGSAPKKTGAQSPKVSPRRGPGRSPPRSDSLSQLHDGNPSMFGRQTTPREGMRALTVMTGQAVQGMSLPGSQYPVGAVPATASSLARGAGLSSDLVPTPPATPGKGGLVSTLAMATASLGQATPTSSYSPVPPSPGPKSSAVRAAQHASMCLNSHGSPPPPASAAFQQVAADLSSRSLLSKATPRTPGTPARSN